MAFPTNNTNKRSRMGTNVSVMNFVALFDLTIESIHKAAQAVLDDGSTDADITDFMKDLIAIKKLSDKHIKREVIQ